MPFFDGNYQLMSNVTVTVDANGSDVSVVQGGTMEGLRNGMIWEACLTVDGAIDSADGDETLDVYIEEKIGSEYFSISKFPQISAGGTKYKNSEYASSGKGPLRCCFQLSKDATAIRYRNDVGGSTPSYASVNVRLFPTTIGLPI